MLLNPIGVLSHPGPHPGAEAIVDEAIRPSGDGDHTERNRNRDERNYAISYLIHISYCIVANAFVLTAGVWYSTATVRVHRIGRGDDGARPSIKLCTRTRPKSNV